MKGSTVAVIGVGAVLGYALLSSSKKTDDGTGASGFSFGGLSLPGINLDLAGLGGGQDNSGLMALIIDMLNKPLASVGGGIAGGIADTIPGVSTVIDAAAKIRKEYESAIEALKKSYDNAAGGVTELADQLAGLLDKAMNTEIPTPGGEKGPNAERPSVSIPFDYPQGPEKFGRTIWALGDYARRGILDLVTVNPVFGEGMNPNTYENNMRAMRNATNSWESKVGAGLEPTPEVAIPGSGWQEGLNEDNYYYYIPGF